ncbi:heavy-metal-associated domain-containing protein [Amycolatopsis nigrescens]|uniref:heavy-metal-associated domain-containing protein n=1 Tax=Amycolatopsis nigrescens TaxID=381445 RepID=UPI000371C5A9|nr:heavy-metal-associated domain-containing protein [Amycolatopsis nigrescens]
MAESSYTVHGMTCGHCASSVTEEVGKLPGVQKIDVDVPSRKMVAISAAPLRTEDVREAVTEAGYQLVS